MKFEQTGAGSYALDVCGHTCPAPQMYTKKALQKMGRGDLLTLTFDNPSSGESIAAMCEADGNDLVERSERDGTSTWTIRKG